MISAHTPLAFEAQPSFMAERELQIDKIAQSLLFAARMMRPPVDSRELVVEPTLDPTRHVLDLGALPEHDLTDDAVFSYYTERGIMDNPLVRKEFGLPRTIGELNDRYVTAVSMAGLVLLHERGRVTVNMLDSPLVDEPYKEARNLGVNAALLPDTRERAWSSFEETVPKLEDYARKKRERILFERSPEYLRKMAERARQDREEQTARFDVVAPNVTPAARSAIRSGERPIASNDTGGYSAEDVNGDIYVVEPDGTRWLSYSAASGLMYFGPDDLIGTHAE